MDPKPAHPAVMPTYGSPELGFDRGEGCWLITADGRRYLDFGAGIAVASLGHCHPHLVAAIRDQAGRLIHTSNLYRIEGQWRLAERLVAKSFAETVFFSNSGVEAWEGGVKLCRKYQAATGNPQRWRVITVTGAFHGRTLAAIAAAKTDKLVQGFGPMADGFDQVPFGNMNALRAAITEETAAINVEPILGEGGIRVAPADYLRDLRATADEFGLLLYFDEIQCGYGRTGKLFAHEWAGITPDVLCAAKGIGGGFPLGAILATATAAQGMTAGSHGSTYGGNPLAMAAGNAVLDVLEADGFLDGVVDRGRELAAGLADLIARHRDLFQEARGMGLMQGLKLKIPNGALIAAAQAEGLLLVPGADNVVRLLPPLVVTADEIQDALSRLDRAAVTCRPARAAAG